jgi:hypothetical protein
VFDGFLPPESKLKPLDVMDSAASQELIVSAYQEQHDHWNKEVIMLEAAILKLGDDMHTLKAMKDKWWEWPLKLLKRKTKRERIMEAKKTELKALEVRYERELNAMPNANAYELAMLGGGIFKVK